MHARRAITLPVLGLLALPLALCATSCKKGFGSGFEGEITMQIHSATRDSSMVVKTKGDKIRFEMGAGTGYMLFDSKANTFVMVNDGSKSFTDIDFAHPGAPQPNTSATTSTIDKSGKHETIAGIDCEDWTVHDGKKRTEACIAQGIAFVDLGSAKSGSGGGTFAKELREKKLFPLRSVEYDAAGTELSRMEVTKVDKKSLGDDQFEVPKDYTKITLPSP